MIYLIVKHDIDCTSELTSPHGYTKSEHEAELVCEELNKNLENPKGSNIFYAFETVQLLIP